MTRPSNCTRWAPPTPWATWWSTFPSRESSSCGDVVFIGDHPCHWAGPLENTAAACRRILDLKPEWIVPGHGPVLNPGGLIAYIEYLEDLAGQALLMHGQGRTPVEAAEILIDEDRYPGLGLAERMAITLAGEWRHLNGDTSDPDLVGLVGSAARIAWSRSGTAPTTAEATAATAP